MTQLLTSSPWIFAGGNFSAGYDLKELAQDAAAAKYEQDVTKDPGPLVCIIKHHEEDAHPLYVED